MANTTVEQRSILVELRVGDIVAVGSADYLNYVKIVKIEEVESKLYAGIYFCKFTGEFQDCFNGVWKTSPGSDKLTFYQNMIHVPAGVIRLAK